jgi:hypothetical protein
MTTVARAGVKFMMSAFVYNLVQLRHLARNFNLAEDIKKKNKLEETS